MELAAPQVIAAVVVAATGAKAELVPVHRELAAAEEAAMAGLVEKAVIEQAEAEEVMAPLEALEPPMELEAEEDMD